MKATGKERAATAAESAIDLNVESGEDVDGNPLHQWHKVERQRTWEEWKSQPLNKDVSHKKAYHWPGEGEQRKKQETASPLALADEQQPPLELSRSDTRDATQRQGMRWNWHGSNSTGGD